MGDVLRNILMLTWMACAFNSNAVAADNNFSVEEEVPINSLQPTVVWGEAKTAKGGDNQIIIEQPSNSGNPLGNPFIPENDSTLSKKDSGENEDNEVVSNTTSKQQKIKAIEQSNMQGILKPWQEPLPQPSDKIENELYQSGNDIIDVQAYPIKDVSTVTEPNIQPIIVTQ